MDQNEAKTSIFWWTKYQKFEEIRFLHILATTKNEYAEQSLSWRSQILNFVIWSAEEK